MRYAIGVDIGGTAVKMGVIEDDVKLVYSDQTPSNHDPAQMARDIARMVRKAWKEFPGIPVGGACAGAVNGKLVTASNMGWKEAPLGECLERELGMPVPLCNDAKAALLGEWRHGALKGAQHAVYLTLGTGVGGSIVANGALYTGNMGLGGEIGHMITHAGGRMCPCGQQGCYELYASASALSRMAGGMPTKTVVEHARKGEMLDVWHAYLDEVGIGLINVCAIFAPEVIAIGGGLSNAGQFFEDSLLERLYALPGFGYYRNRIRVCRGKFEGRSGVIGAASLAVQAE